MAFNFPKFVYLKKNQNSVDFDRIDHVDSVECCQRKQLCARMHFGYNFPK